MDGSNLETVGSSVVSEYSQASSSGTASRSKGQGKPGDDVSVITGRGRVASEPGQDAVTPHSLRRQRTTSETGTAPTDTADKKKINQRKLALLSRTFSFDFQALKQTISPLDKRIGVLDSLLNNGSLEDIDYLRRIVKDPKKLDYLLQHARCLELAHNKVRKAATEEFRSSGISDVKSTSIGDSEAGEVQKTRSVAIESPNHHHRIYEIKSDQVNLFVGGLVHPATYSARNKPVNLETSTSAGCLVDTVETVSVDDSNPPIIKDGVMTTGGLSGDLACDYWRVVLERKIDRVIALQDFGIHLSYMPSFLSSVGPWLIWKIKDRFKIEIIRVEQQKDLIDCYVNSKKNGNPNITAQDVVLKITDCLEKNEPREVTVSQYFFWSDAFVLEKELSRALVDKVPEKGCLIHCQAGQNRSPALVAMKILKESHACGRLSKENYIEAVVDVLNLVQIQRDAVEKPDQNARKSIILYVEDILGMKDVDDQSARLQQPDIQTAPVTTLRPEFALLEMLSADGEEPFFSI
ncbi:protein-tyrosine phosphatase family protein [Endozoicomonas elysicola]|uniref:Tyrosine specific protein phosphatases domain-containing protein n=1 Tax=Endozoicomonas elysicola TaxID=305900 RepID=A0A081K745_9GAMM|nr:protein-tyrosine phosphatase family protein [Endozoicomonas elysicola]KEI69971.1 hypothetical protein GV64_03715 [Endozoicomonas elysicola]